MARISQVCFPAARVSQSDKGSVNRAEVRDLADVYLLAKRFGYNVLVERATEMAARADSGGPGIRQLSHVRLLAGSSLRPKVRPPPVSASDHPDLGSAR